MEEDPGPSKSSCLLGLLVSCRFSSVLSFARCPMHDQSPAATGQNTSAACCMSTLSRRRHRPAIAAASPARSATKLFELLLHVLLGFGADLVH